MRIIEIKGEFYRQLEVSEKIQTVDMFRRRSGNRIKYVRSLRNGEVVKFSGSIYLRPVDPLLAAVILARNEKSK